MTNCRVVWIFVTLALSTGGCGPYVALTAAFPDTADAGKHLGRTIRAGSPDAQVAFGVSAPVDVAIQGVVESTVANSLGMALSAAVGTCTVNNANVVVQSYTTTQTQYLRAMTPPTTDWVWTNSACCSADGKPTNDCASKVITAFYKTKVTIKAQTSATVAGQLTCPNASLNVQVDPTGTTMATSEGWNLVKVDNLESVCKQKR